jgi:hypothetical protein
MILSRHLGVAPPARAGTRQRAATAAGGRRDKAAPSASQKPPEIERALRLRAQLAELRDQLIRRLLTRFEPGKLELLGHTGAALSALADMIDDQPPPLGCDS